MSKIGESGSEKISKGKRSAPKTVLIRNRWITVWQESLRIGGKIIPDYYFVKRGDVVVVVPIIKKDGVIMLRQWRPIPRRYIYNLPMGLVEKSDASPRTAALRKLKEEIGGIPEKLFSMGWYWRAPAYLTTKVHVFVALYHKAPRANISDGTEMATPNLFTLRDAKRSTKDLSSLAALSLAEKWLQKSPRRQLQARAKIAL